MADFALTFEEPDDIPSRADTVTADHLDVEDLEPAGTPPTVSELQVRLLLGLVGSLVARIPAAGDDDVPDAWRFTDAELDDLTPPLTRIINRRPELVAAVHRGDEVAVAITLATYTGRNVADLRRARKARDADLNRQAPDLGPDGGADAPGGGPEGPDGGRVGGLGTPDAG